MCRCSINMNGCALRLGRVPSCLSKRQRALHDPQRQGESKKTPEAVITAAFAYHSFSDLDKHSRHVPPLVNVLTILTTAGSLHASHFHGVRERKIARYRSHPEGNYYRRSD